MGIVTLSPTGAGDATTYARWMPTLVAAVLAFSLAGLALPLTPPAAVTPSRVFLDASPGISPSAQPGNSWALGVHAVKGSPDPADVQGVEMTAYLPAIPSGLTSTSGPYYMLVLSVIFPNGRFAQIDVRASPAGVDGCSPVACYQSVYNIAKFPGSVSAFSIQGELPGSWYTLAIWRDGSAGKWRYGIARGTPGSLTVQRNDFLTTLDANFGDADAYASLAVNQVDEWFGTTYILQEFAALETYDASSSDWGRIHTLTFSPALGFFQGNATSSWPTMAPPGAALGCSTGIVCTDPNGVQYLGFIGCCSAAPAFAWIQGQFQGQPRADLFLAGANTTSPTAAPGAILWAELPAITRAGFTPNGIRPGGTTNVTLTVTNPNGFPLFLGLRASVRSDPGGAIMANAVPDVPGANRASGTTALSLPASTSSFPQGWYDLDVDLWSGTPGASPAVLLSTSGWLNKSLSVDSTPPTTTASVVGTVGLSGWYRSTVKVTLNASEPFGNVAATWYRLDGTNATPYTAYTGPVDVTSDGSHTLTYYSVDTAGNTEAPRTLAFKQDATPPNVAVGYPASGADLANGTFTVTWTTSDAGSGLAYTTIALDGGAPVNVSRAASYSFRGVANGSHTVTVTSYDFAGNAGVAAVRFDVGPVLPVALLIGVGLAAAVVAVVMAALLLARRRRPPA